MQYMEVAMRMEGGWIEVICGGMFSGKTEELIRRVKALQYARRKVKIFVPAIDNRYATQAVVSHNGAKLTAYPVNKIEDILAEVEKSADIEVVAVDEVQFLDNTPAEIVTGFEKLANRGLRVILAGLDQDYRARPFPPVPDLIAVAEFVTKLLAICPVCGRPAGRSQRLINGAPAPLDGPTISIGGTDLYEPRCRAHYQLPGSIHCDETRSAE